MTATPLKSLLWLVALNLSLLVPVAAQRPSPSPPLEPPAPKSIVRGRIVYADNGSPVRRSTVTLMQLPERGRELTGATGRDGRFEIQNVPAGVYFVIADSPGLITPIAFMKFNERSDPELMNGKDLKEYCTQISVDGTNNLDITVRAHRGGAISGKVTYSDGAPAVNSVMSVLRRRGNQVDRVLTGVSGGALLSLQTDDRGRYRIAGLPPGDYLVSASEKNTAPESRGRYGDPFSDLLRSDALAISYYGNGAKLADAVTLKVDLGTELSNIDITLSDTTPHTITGTVVSKIDGHALTGARVTIRNKEQDTWFNNGQQQMSTDSDGRWLMVDVPDGTYLISVEPPYREQEAPTTRDTESDEKRPAIRTPNFVAKQVEVAVAGSDVVGVEIQLTEGASISGTIEFPPGNQTDREYVTLRYTYEGQLVDRFAGNVPVFDKTFSIEGLRSGKIFLSIGASEMKYYIKSITLNGADLAQKPLTVESGQSVTNIRVVLGADLGEAKVQLMDRSAKPIAARRIAIVSAAASVGNLAAGFAAEVTDANGIVSFSGAPGEYVVIVAGIDESWPMSTDTIRSRSESAARFKLQPGDNKTIVLTVDR